MALQKEYLDLIEFCFDDTFYPDALGNLYPSERFSLYRYFHDLPTTTRRTETVSVSVYPTDRWVMPYGMPPEEFVRRLQNVPEPTADHAALAEKLGIATGKLVAAIAVPHFLNVQYQFGAVAEILELEFTKMLEANVRFRKCKRCGKYFIMKGNYDTQIVLSRHRKSPESLDLQGVPGLNCLLPLSAGLLLLNKFVQKKCFLLSGRFALSEVCRLSDMRCRCVATGQLQYSGCVSNLQGELCSFEYS